MPDEKTTTAPTPGTLPEDPKIREAFVKAREAERKLKAKEEAENKAHLAELAGPEYDHVGDVGIDETLYKIPEGPKPKVPWGKPVKKRKLGKSTEVRQRVLDILEAEHPPEKQVELNSTPLTEPADEGGQTAPETDRLLSHRIGVEKALRGFAEKMATGNSGPQRKNKLLKKLENERIDKFDEEAENLFPKNR